MSEAPENHGQALGLAPWDTHNQALAAHVHPQGYRNPESANRYKLVVLGGGPAGLVTAVASANLGARVALVERHLLGGDCLNVGCVPSKALIRAARAVAEVRRAEDFGVRIRGEVEVDFPALMERMRRLRADLSHHDSAQRFTDLGIDVFLGSGVFTGPGSLEVGGATLRFDRACIATGARPAVPPVPGLGEAGFLTNEQIFNLTELPPRLAILGAGPIGCEMAQCFARFGSQVTLLDRSEQVLSREDPDAAARVAEALERDGVDLRLGASLEAVERAGEARRLRGTRGTGAFELEVDQLLVAAGRAPNVLGMGLEAAGVEYDEFKGVRVDDHLRTSNPRVFAAGDVCSATKFTHTADFQARAVIRNALFPLGNARASQLNIPWVTYTEPEVAHVGLSEAEAERRGIPLDTFLQPLSGVDRAVLEGDDEGFVKIHVARGTDHILGATLVGAHAGEMLSEVSVAMQSGMGLGQLANVIHPYPTTADAIRKCGDLYNKTRVKPWIRRLFGWWLGGGE